MGPSSSSTSADAALVDPGFVPTCSGCAYDLRGIPDGVCPECGKAFTVAELFAESRKALSSRSEVSANWLLVVMFVPTFLCSPVLAGRGHDIEQARTVWMGFLWSLSLFWLVRRWPAGYGRGQWQLAWFAFPAALSLLAVLSRTPFALIGPGCMVFAGIGWVCIRLGRAWLVPLIGGALVTIIGASLLSATMERAARGFEWSLLSDPRPGQVHDQYPLRIAEALWFSGTLVAAGLALGLLSAVVFCRRRRA